jgi:murein DD-endopeptidase MepM/ murein hydrolase activator NlpD
VIRRLPFLALVLILGVAMAAPAGGADLSTDLARVRERIDQVRSQISTAAADRSAVAQDVLAAADALDAAEADVTETSDRLAAVSLQLDERTAALAEVRSDLAEQLAALARIGEQRDAARSDAERWVLDAYMGTGTAEPSIAFNAKQVSDVSVGVAYLDVLASHSSDAADRYAALTDEESAKADDIRAVEASIVAEVTEIEGLGREIGGLETQLEARKVILTEAYATQKETLDRLDADIAEFEGELASLAAEEASIRAQIAARTAATSTPSVSGSGFVRPVPGGVSSGFGMRIHPITGTRRMHNGLDMNASQGDPIRAARAGTVILAGVKGGYGNTVMIDHGGGMVTLYAHQSKLGVTVGQRVEAGEVIGWVGSTGDSTAPHLHFEVRINGSPVDPMKYL